MSVCVCKAQIPQCTSKGGGGGYPLHELSRIILRCCPTYLKVACKRACVFPPDVHRGFFFFCVCALHSVCMCVQVRRKWETDELSVTELS